MDAWVGGCQTEKESERTEMDDRVADSDTFFCLSSVPLAETCIAARAWQSSVQTQFLRVAGYANLLQAVYVYSSEIFAS